MNQEIKMTFRSFLERLGDFKGQAKILPDSCIRIGKWNLCPISAVWSKEGEMSPEALNNNIAVEYGQELGLHPQVIDQVINSADWPLPPGPMRGLILEALGLSERVEREVDQ